MEDTVNLINSRLKERRRELGLPEAIKVGIHVSPGRRLVQGIIRAVPVCAGHVPCPDEYGENQPAEVFAPLRESAWTTGRNRPNKRMYLRQRAVGFCQHLCVSSEPQAGVDPGATVLRALPPAQTSAAFLSSNSHHHHCE